MNKIFQYEWLLWLLCGVVILGISCLAYRVRKKGIDPFPTRAKIEKHWKTINKFMNIIAIGMIVLTATTAVRSISTLVHDLRYPIVPLGEESRRIPLSIIYTLAASHLGLIAFFAGITTFFQRNLTFVKRFVLLIISVLPMFFLSLWLFVDNSASLAKKFDFVIGCFLITAIINGPGIISGTSLFELIEKIPSKFDQKAQQN